MDVQELIQQLEGLDDQVKLLVKTEKRLHGAHRIIEEQLRQFKALNTLVLCVGRANGPEAILEITLGTLLQVLRVDQCAAFLAQPGDNFPLAALKTQRGFEPPAGNSWSAQTRPPHISQLVFGQSGRAELLDEETRHYLDAVGAYFGRTGAVTARAAIEIILPLFRTNKELLGIIVLRKGDLSKSLHEHLVSENDVAFLELVGAHTEAALENVILYQELSSFAFQLEKKVAERTADLAHANEGLARSQKELAEALAFREQVMGILGHDLRNPLSAVRMATELLLRRNGFPDDVIRSLSRIDSATRRMVEMIGTLLDFSQSRFRKDLPVSPVTTDLHEVCRGVVDELQAANPARVIQLELKGNGFGEWDPARMAQVVSNLVANALTHGAKNEPVCVSACANDETGMVLEVRNLGPLIPTELMPVLFEPFRRGASAEKRVSGGLGLGLYIVRQIVLAHGGTVTAKSTAQEGTTFTVRLPRSGR